MMGNHAFMECTPRVANHLEACEGMGEMAPGSVKRLVEALKEAEAILDDVADHMPHASDTLEKVQQALRDLGEEA